MSLHSSYFVLKAVIHHYHQGTHLTSRNFIDYVMVRPLSRGVGL